MMNIRTRPKILVVTCMANRPKISDIFAHNITKIKELYKMDYDIQIYAGCDFGDDLSEAICHHHGINYVGIPSRSLSEKWNLTLDYAIIQNDGVFDYVYITGDDNLVDPNIFNLYQSKIERGVDVFGLNNIFFLSPATKEALNFSYHHKNKVLGAGRMISCKAITATSIMKPVKVIKDFTITYNPQIADRQYKRHDCINIPAVKYDYLSGIGFVKSAGDNYFEFWPKGINSGLDTHSDIKLLFGGFHPVGIHTLLPYMMDIKTNVNVWKFDDYRNVSKPYDYNQAMNAFLDNKEKELINKL